MDKQLLTPKEAAEFLGFSVNALSIWRRKERGPKYIRKGYKTIMYHISELKKFKAQYEVVDETDGD